VDVLPRVVVRRDTRLRQLTTEQGEPASCRLGDLLG
jgi:hypothetical protein